MVGATLKKPEQEAMHMEKRISLSFKFSAIYIH